MDEHDEYGSDDGFDLLPANTLAQLENDAFASTQQHKSAISHGPRYRTAAHPQLRESATQSAAGEYVKAPAEYGFDDEEIIDLGSMPQDSRLAVNQWPTRTAIPNEDILHNDDHEQEQTLQGDSTDVTDLQQRIRELEARCANLQKTTAAAQVALQSKAGENAVLRQRMESTSREHEQKLSTMRVLHNEASTKLKVELEATKRDREKIATDNQFLTHDLAIEAGKQKAARKPQRMESRPTPVTTPKKDRTLPFRDGFDDSDIVMLSPSKARDKGKQMTPKHPNKRKRVAEDQSPIKPLVVQSFGTTGSNSPSGASVVAFESDNREHPSDTSANHDRVNLIRGFLDCRYQGRPSQDRVIEILTRHSFPSQPEKKLSSIIYDRLEEWTNDTQSVSLSSCLCNSLLDLWDQCIKEKYYDPVDLLVDFFSSVLSDELFDFVQSYAARVVPLAMATCDLVAIPLARESIKQSKGQYTAQPQNANATPQINVEACLELLNYVAEACLDEPEAITTFWRCMKFDFVLLMLMRAQPLPQILLMLRLLRSSVLPTSFGASLESDSGVQERRRSREADTVNRLSLLLFEKFASKTQEPAPQVEQHPGRRIIKKPEPPSEEAKLKAIDAAMHHHSAVLTLRLEILSIFLTLCTTSHGTLLLSTHKYALGRLVRNLHNSVTELYTYSRLTHNKHIRAINGSMRIIHHIVTASSSPASPPASPTTANADPAIPPLDVKEKLRSIQGGPQMWLLALTRLAFMEGLVAEEGILPETSDMAHQLLDEYLSPDEGEALLEAFGGSGVSGG